VRRCGKDVMSLEIASSNQPNQHNNTKIMKTTHLQHTLKCGLLAGLLIGLGMLHAHAQFSFNSGSDGSSGAMNITNDTTLALPANGIFKCTTITVASNATLRFIPNDLNTPVYLLAQGDVTINGAIDVSGAEATALLGGSGGPGGFAGGNPGVANLPAGDGKGPGAGRAGPAWGETAGGDVGAGSYGSVGWSARPTTNTGTTYGSPLLVPLVGGSGGGGTRYGSGGAGGGGAVLLASNTRIAVNGAILATSPDRNTGLGNSGRGSGGAIRLVAPTVAGTGILNVGGGYNTFYGQMVGGLGRMRIDCMDRHLLAMNFIGQASVGANMIVFPTNSPRLDIIQVAGTNITVGTSAPVFFMLPQGSSTNQTVRVQASNFGGLVPIRVVLTPDNGPSSSFDAQIDNSTTNPASVTVPVVVPVNVQVQVNAWTR
jgi:hypothetical protein